MVMVDEKLSEFDIENEIKTQNYIMIEFFTSRCPYCIAMESVLKKVSEKFEKKQVKLIKINADEYEELANRYSIRSVPSFLLFQNGNLISREIGKLSEKQLLNMIDILN